MTWLLQFGTLALLCTMACSGPDADDPDALGPDDPDALPAGPAAPPDASFVLFAVHSGNVVVPLACRSPDDGPMLTGAGCLEMLPEGELELDVGNGLRATVADRTSVQCLSGSTQQGLDLVRKVESWPVVTWSQAPVPWCSFRQAAPDDPLDEVLVTTLQQEAAALDLTLEPPQPSAIRIVPLYTLDLDGDQQADTIVKAIWPDPPPPEPSEDEDEDEDEKKDEDAELPPPPPPQEELLVAMGGYQVQRFALPLPHLVELTGSVDLDGDGRCEVVVAAERTDGSSVALGRWTDGRIELISAYECGI